MTHATRNTTTGLKFHKRPAQQMKITNLRIQNI